MGQYKDIIDGFLNTSSMLCFVWGPMKLMLLVSNLRAPMAYLRTTHGGMTETDRGQIASNWSKSFDILLDAYKQISEHFPQLLQYRAMFAENEHLRRVLVWIYEDVLMFHLRAWRVFAQPGRQSVDPI
jgi:hypothetical protein